MDRFVKQVALFCAAIGTVSSSSAYATSLDFFLTVNVVTNTWDLAASTDSPGGIGAIVVNLINFGNGTSVAPRSVFGSVPIKGFIEGYFSLPVTPLFPPDHPAWGQAFAAQVPLDVNSIVYGVGYTPVPDSDFGVQLPTIGMIGSALAVPTVFYTGSYDPTQGQPDFHPQQNAIFGSVYISPPPPGGYTTPVLPSDITFTPQIATYNLLIVPEPSTWLLSLAGVLFLFSKTACRRQRPRADCACPWHPAIFGGTFRV